MNKRTSRGGGFFLMLAILIGLGWGIAADAPAIGVLTGTAIGALIVAMLWILDRRA